MSSDYVIAPLLNAEGRRIGWVPTHIERLTIEQREWSRRVRAQARRKELSDDAIERGKTQASKAA